MYNKINFKYVFSHQGVVHFATSSGFSETSQPCYVVLSENMAKHKVARYDSGFNIN